MLFDSHSHRFFEKTRRYLSNFSNPTLANKTLYQSKNKQLNKIRPYTTFKNLPHHSINAFIVSCICFVEYLPHHVQYIPNQHIIPYQRTSEIIFL